MSPRPPFKFSAWTRVGFSDTDAQGIVYYGRYMPYFDLARVEYHRALDMLRTGPEGEQFVRGRCTVEYLAPARFDDEIEVDVRISADRHVQRHLRVRRLPPRRRAGRQANPDRGAGRSRQARAVPRAGLVAREDQRVRRGRSRRHKAARAHPFPPNEWALLACATSPVCPHSCCRRRPAGAIPRPR